MTRRDTAVHRLRLLLALTGAAIALAACGGSTPAPAPGSSQNPLSAKQTPSDDDSSAAHHPRAGGAPCNLVTAAQARAILGAPMRAPVVAAQGPTCIYRTRDGGGFVTLAVQARDFQTLRPHLRLARRVSVAGRAAWCGTYGQPMLYVPLARGRLLSVAARCAVGRRFALRAVRRLPGS
jgi:Protein of unknown function (DUF3558)